MSANSDSKKPAAGPTLPTYGRPITLAEAKRVAAAAVAPAQANGWTMVIAVVDTGGHLVYLEKMDQTQTGSVVVAQDKARAAAMFKRPTKALQDVLAAGGDGWRVLRITGAIPVEGGVPLIINGELIGALGVSGGSSAEDGVCATAGVAALG